MSNAFEGFINKAADINVRKPAKEIYSSFKKGDPNVLAGEVLKQGALLVPRNTAAISNWTLGLMFKLLGGTVRTGLQAATLIPLPIPGGARSIAQVRGDLGALRQAYESKVAGNPRSFSEILAATKGNNVPPPENFSQAA